MARFCGDEAHESRSNSPDEVKRLDPQESHERLNILRSVHVHECSKNVRCVGTSWSSDIHSCTRFWVCFCLDESSTNAIKAWRVLGRLQERERECACMFVRKPTSDWMSVILVTVTHEMKWTQVTSIVFEPCMGKCVSAKSPGKTHTMGTGASGSTPDGITPQVKELANFTQFMTTNL